MNERVGSRIKERRKSLHYTQEELARLCGTSHATVCRWEKGLVENIPQTQILKLANALRCDPVWLMDFVPEEYDNTLKHIMDAIETEEDFVMGLKELCLAWGNIGKNFDDDDWEDITHYIKFKAMRKK